MGVKKLPVILRILKKGIILITLGGGDAYVAEELTGKKPGSRNTNRHRHTGDTFNNYIQNDRLQGRNRS
jgi:hypothetical protein